MNFDSRAVTRRLTTLVCVPLALSSFACGDDGGDGMGDGLAPAVEVAFPPPVSLTDAATITVRGRASDPDSIAAIRVNGDVATTDDGFAEWRATVALVPGANAIIITSEDSLGVVDESAAVVNVELSNNWLDVPTAVVADTANQRALALDRVLDAVLSIDYATGTRTILSGDAVGSGPALDDPIGLFHDPANDTVLVLDRGLGALLEVTLDGGARTVVSDAVTGAGPALTQPTHLAVDLAAGQAWVLDTDATDPLNPVPVIVAVDLATGDRSVLVDPSTGDRPALIEPSALAYDGVGARLLVADLDITDPLNPIVIIAAVDPGSAALSLVSDDLAVPLANPRSMALDEDVAPGTLVVLDDGSDMVVAVDLATGARTVISEDGVSAGRNFSVPVSIALERLDASTTRALVIDTGIDELLAVDLDDGARSVLSAVALGDGPSLAQPMAVVWDAPASSLGRALVVDPGDDALVTVDLATAGRSTVSNDDVGAGEILANPVALTLDVAVDLFGQAEAATRALVVDEGADAVIGIDLASGARTELSGPNAGAGEQFAAPMGVTFEPGDAEAGTADRLLVADEGLGAIVAVDLATGERALVTDEDGANGPVLGAPQAIALELDATGYTGRALVVDRDPPTLVAVDLATGRRTLVSGEGTGDGPPLDAPSNVILELSPAPQPDPEAMPTEPVPLHLPTGYALVVHQGNGSLMAVNLENGRRTELYNAEIGLGPILDRPTSIALDATNERLLMADEGMRSLLMIDLRTSERVLVTR